MEDVLKVLESVFSDDKIQKIAIFGTSDLKKKDRLKAYEEQSGKSFFYISLVSTNVAIEQIQKEIFNKIIPELFWRNLWWRIRQEVAEFTIFGYGFKFSRIDESYFENRIPSLLNKIQKRNAIVFDSFDQFNDNIKCLYYLNSLLNNVNNKAVQCKVRTYRKNCTNKFPPIRFFYLISSDTRKERRELFDYVVHVPVPHELPKNNNLSTHAYNGMYTDEHDKLNKFSGRDDKLEAIHDEFKENRAKKDKPTCVKQTIAGMSGVGKTRLVLEYAHRYGSEYIDAIWWIDADISPMTDLSEFAKELGLVEGDTLNEGVICKQLWDWCDNHNSFLLIFDNVNEAEDIRPFISRINTGHVLIIALNSNLNLSGITTNLDVFDVMDAKTFMRDRLSEIANCDEEALLYLIEQLGRFPLALEHAANFINASPKYHDCRQYSVLLEKCGVKLLDQNEDKKGYHNKIATTTWKLSFEKLREPAAQQLFYLCAYMAPNDIPLHFFKQQREVLVHESLRNKLSNSVETDKLIQNLMEYALVKSDGELLQMHRFLQDVVQYALAEAGDTQWLSYCLTMEYNGFNYKYGDKESMAAFTQNVSHILKIANQAKDVFSDYEAKEKVAWLFHRVGDGYTRGGRQNDALKWLKEALIICEKVLGEEHHLTPTTYNNMGLAYSRQGKYSEAFQHHQKALNIYENKLGIKHPLTATTYNNIARIYYYWGEYSEALQHHQKALNVFKKEVNPEYPFAAITYNNIARIYSAQGKYSEACEDYQKALNIYKKKLDTKHPDIATVYNNIATVYYYQGNYANALNNYQKALNIYKDKFGIEHPLIAGTYNNMGLIYAVQGDYSNALEYHQKALNIFKKEVDSEHSDIAITYNNIATVYYYQGNYSNALNDYQKALNIRKKVLKKEHPLTATTYNNMGLVYAAHGDYSNALEYHQKALNIYKKKLDPEHPLIAGTYDNIGLVYVNQGNYSEALQLHQKALDIRYTVLGEEHPLTAITYNNIAGVHNSQGNYLDALELYRKSYEILRHKLGDTHPTTNFVKECREITSQNAACLNRSVETTLKTHITTKLISSKVLLKAFLARFRVRSK